MKKIALSLIAALLLSPFSVVLAKTHPESTVPPAPVPGKRKPIVMKWETLGGLQYFYSGVKVANDDDLKGVISPLHDSEADRLLDKSKDSHGSGMFYLFGGIGVLIGGGVVLGSDPNIKSSTIDGQEIAGGALVLLGIVGTYVGTFKMIDSQTEKFAAVQRYNAVIHGDDLESFHPIHRSGVNADLLTFKF